jgi:ABC-2 type transport system permease protein
MKQYLIVSKQLILNSWSYLLTYRSNLAMNLIAAIGWATVHLATIELLFLHTESILGYSQFDMILLIFSFACIADFAGAFTGNITLLEQDIREGNLDGYILKPIDTMILYTCSKFRLTDLLFFFVHVIPYLVIMAKHAEPIELIQIPLYLVALVCGMIIYVSIKIFVNTINFWWQKMDNLFHLMYTIFEVGKYPLTIFPGFVRVLMFTLVPVAFAAYVPVNILTGRADMLTYALMPIVTILTMVVTRTFWNISLNKYSSAS